MATIEKAEKKKNIPEDTTCRVAEVIAKEREHLGLDKQERVSGFAISGGGIRSASFGLGVMQALVANKQLEKMDYMSTVSGGGYLGSALTWALKQGGAEAGTKKENFPLGKKDSFSRQDDTHKPQQPDLQNNGLLDYIRQHSSYLMPVGKLGLFSFAGVVLRSILLSLSIYFGLLMVLMAVLRVSGVFDGYGPLKGYGLLIPFALALIFLFLVLSFAYSLQTFFSRDSGLNSYLGFIRGQSRTGWIWKISLICLLIGSIPFVERWLNTMMSSATAAAGSSTLYGVLVGIWQYVKAQKSEMSKGPISDVLIYLAAFALVYGLLLLAYLSSWTFVQTDSFDWTAFICFCIVVFSFATLVNLNLVGPHRLWRDRLMEAFMPDREAVRDNKWMPASEADSALMADMCDQHNPRPYHIINTNIILANSPQVKFRGRGGDNFIISPLYCGSEATGWRTTRTFQHNGGRGITLATAMATSAAALNPDAAVSGEGLTRGTMISLILSLMNLRLGYWTVNPAKNIWPVPPSFLVPGLTTEIVRDGFRESDTRVLLSDGGHFENLAIYELIRRKVNLIVLSDGGADGAFNFDDLANAVEKVRVDFGAKIVFIDKEGQSYGPNGMLFDATGRTAFQKKYEIAERGYAIADIYYNDGSTGKLVYLKLAMINELPTDVYSYKGLNPTFPHQSTADQFFDEKQFEAYRELGYNAALKMMDSEEGKKLFVKG